MAGRRQSARSEENRAAWAQRPDRRHEEFAEGNVEALTHGAKSRLVGPAASALVAEIAGAMPVLAEPRYRRAVEAWAQVEAKLDRLRPYIDEVPLADLAADRGASSFYIQMERLALRLRAQLALDLASAAVVGKSDLGRTVDSGRARSMVLALHEDIKRVVDSGKLEEFAARAAEARR